MEFRSELLALSQNLLPDTNISLPERYDKASFIKHLSPYLANLLEKDFQYLVQIMYRIDVPEKEFTLTLQAGVVEDVPAALAELIFDRLYVKAQFRAKYRAK